MTIEDVLAELRARADALPHDSGARLEARAALAAAEDHLRQARDCAGRAERALAPQPELREGVIRL